jgi:uncharacterized OsmC-like protein
MLLTDQPPKPRFNGIDLQALDEMVVDVKRNPEGGIAGFRVKTEWKGQTRSESRVESFTCAGEVVPRTFTIVADEPRELLGADTAPNPQELFLSALNSCMIVGYVVQAAVRGITLKDCRIESDADLNLRGFLGLDETIPPGHRRINYIVYLDGDGTPEQHEEIHQAVMATSPNYFNVAQPLQMCGRLGQTDERCCP